MDPRREHRLEPVHRRRGRHTQGVRAARLPARGHRRDQDGIEGPRPDAGGHGVRHRQDAHLAATVGGAVPGRHGPVPRPVHQPRVPDHARMGRPGARPHQPVRRVLRREGVQTQGRRELWPAVRHPVSRDHERGHHRLPLPQARRRVERGVLHLPVHRRGRPRPTARPARLRPDRMR